MNYIKEAETINLLSKTQTFVQEQLNAAEKGHDWWHISRVWNNTLELLKSEPDANPLVSQLAALLHDIADSKFHGGDEKLGARVAGAFLREQGVEEETILHVENIINNLSFTASLGKKEFHSKELEIVQDADRLDAMGAIGVARAFHYGGYKNRELYNPKTPPQPNQSKEAYKNSQAPTINHFFEKLLKLKAQMNTRTGRELAEKRHAFMLCFLENFFSEWGKPYLRPKD